MSNIFFRAVTYVTVAFLSGCAAGAVPGGDARPNRSDASDVGGDLTVSMDADDVAPRDTTIVPIEVGTQNPDAEVTIVDSAGVWGDVISSADACGTDAAAALGPGCAATEVCANGLDDDCNGAVDDLASCLCIPGMVQPCFAGPPGFRGHGTCVDGQQTCQGSGEFGTWGPCQGGIAPTAEACDMADNNCDGRVDEGCCRIVGSCPSADDPRVPVGRPFQPYTLDGGQFYMAAATSWSWHVEGGPCDRLLWATSNHVSYNLGGGTTGATRDTTGQTLQFAPTLSGDYTVTLTVVGANGDNFTCTFIIKIRAPGFRAELCWDRTGVTDLDLWVHRPADTGDWTASYLVVGLGRINLPSPSNCSYFNCKATRAGTTAINWGYANSPVTNCPAGVTTCYNPRLDVDNIMTQGVPENTNLDNPGDLDDFRITVNFYGGTAGTTQPMVNLYCGGALRATYGGATVSGLLYGSAPIAGFTTPGNDDRGSLWRVADVVMHEPSDSCDVHPLIPTGTTSGTCVATNTDRTYSGACMRRP